MPAVWIILILSFTGIVNTAHLSKHSVTRNDVECPGFPKKWCRKVQYSKYSKTLGIPNSYLGLAIYTAIFLLTFGYMLGVFPYAYSLIPVAILIIAGFLFSAYFTLMQAFILRAFCTWCVLSAVEFFLLAVTILTFGI